MPEHAENSEHDDGQESSGHGDTPDAGHAGHHKKGHHGGHDAGGHGGGEHGGTWLITYCDMITLLIAFFICLLTFASKENGDQTHAKMRDSILYGPGGSGMAGEAHKGSDKGDIVWRQVLTSAHQGEGSRTPSLYSDPTDDKTAKVLQDLENSDTRVLSDTFVLRVPLSLLFDAHEKLTGTGELALIRFSGAIQHLPYDLYIQVADQKQIPLALQLTKHLTQRQGFAPARLGVGIRPLTAIEAQVMDPSLWLVFSPRT